ncbi:amidase [Aneurinibacillus migulanus]|uniref:Amidase n=1 Tax=Aneurinibacillus migulanus TaxID=47500 RepID=A0A0D1XVI2_ANEMI|nr:amidase [Aneurinibacillus migulanus]KIV58151.1 amidase [Aneurinibacillus migulanus]KON96976.1 amidase [Aneurinibacillus migulanus]MED0896215.1 amidase [Aneurinibacillus migulanus]MED1618115.1 amidase [Aneurinibacillus migulanus]SDJ61368.1 aspartyl-tRNA(Asn)/glutamyl-tRNA(Gln) amidotransferase subunit A [Aneurinibacillus migulanus]
MEKMTITNILKGYRCKDFSPVEITEYFLKRIEKLKDLNAYITVCEDKALKQARIAEQKLIVGEEIGRLEGIPISYKDLIYTKDICTTNGSLIDKNFVPCTNAKVVSRLQAEGAINLGKVNLHEYAFGITSNNPFYGSVRNPWNHEYTSGGSSGGSGAAVSANLCTASIGTDTGGSIRIPASSCGVVGLKPTFGYVDGTGVTNLSWSLDHIGPLTRNMDDLSIMMEALTGKCYQNNCIEDVRGLRAGVPRNYFNEQIDKEILDLYNKALQALESMGAILIETDIPFNLNDLQLIFTLAIAEAGYIHNKNMELHIDKYGDDVRTVLEISQSISSLTYIQALKKKNQIKKEFDQLFSMIDILATPTLPTTPKKIGVEEVIIEGITENIFNCMIRYTSVFNLTGNPALSIPCGFTSESLPVGLQFVAGAYREDILFRVGYAYEQSQLAEFYAKRGKLYNQPLSSTT